MSEKIALETAACSDYQELLKMCKSALIAWSTRREELSRFGPRGKSTGDALQKLQAEYARAYNRLERHAKICAVCRFTTELGKSDRSSSVSNSTRKEVSA
jgi:hypothetical protein